MEPTSLRDPHGEPILFIESHHGHPHSVVTSGRSYDFEFIRDPGYLLYHNSGSGCHDRALSIGELSDPTHPAHFWAAPGVRIVDHESRELGPEEIRARGFVRTATTDNPFDDACEGRAVFCSVTGQWWNEERPSRYLQPLECGGTWGGCGAGDDYAGEAASRRSIIDLAAQLGPTKARRLAGLLRQLQNGETISFEKNYRTRRMTLRLHHRGRLSFQFHERLIPDLEAGIAWLETIDAGPAFGHALSAVNWLAQTAQKLAFQRAAARDIRLPRSQRKLWKAIRSAACHAEPREGRAFVHAFLATVKAEEKRSARVDSTPVDPT